MDSSRYLVDIINLKPLFFRSHQALLELPGRLYYGQELIPCAPAPLVSGCLQFPGLTASAQGVTPIIVHGVMGQVKFISILCDDEFGPGTRNILLMSF